MTAIINEKRRHRFYLLDLAQFSGYSVSQTLWSKQTTFILEQ